MWGALPGTRDPAGIPIPSLHLLGFRTSIKWRKLRFEREFPVLKPPGWRMGGIPWEFPGTGNFIYLYIYLFIYLLFIFIFIISLFISSPVQTLGNPNSSPPENIWANFFLFTLKKKCLVFLIPMDFLRDT